MPQSNGMSAAHFDTAIYTMTAQFAFLRAIAQVFVGLALKWGDAEQPVRGLPDKSTAVCRGAGGRFCWSFRAALYPPEAALSTKTSMKAPIHAPSLVFGAS
jgi:hypothetical protein